jgi:hypothetical protein
VSHFGIFFAFYDYERRFIDLPPPISPYSISLRWQSRIGSTALRTKRLETVSPCLAAPPLRSQHKRSGIGPLQSSPPWPLKIWISAGGMKDQKCVILRGTVGGVVTANHDARKRRQPIRQSFCRGPHPGGFSTSAISPISVGYRLSISFQQVKTFFSP